MYDKQQTIFNIILTVGLPGSGKTTKCRELVEKDFSRNFIVCRDDLRDMLSNGRYSKNVEHIVVETQRNIVRTIVTNNHNADGEFNIYIADTNIQWKTRNLWWHYCKSLRSFGYENCLIRYDEDIKFLSVPLEECIKRDSERNRTVGKKVIKTMFKTVLSDLHLRQFLSQEDLEVRHNDE